MKIRPTSTTACLAGAALAVAAAALSPLALAAGAAPSGADTASDCPLPTFGPGATYHPTIDPEDFGPHVTNPLLPFTPGTTLVYAGVKDGKKALDIVIPS